MLNYDRAEYKLVPELIGLTYQPRITTLLLSTFVANVDNSSVVIRVRNVKPRWLRAKGYGRTISGR